MATLARRGFPRWRLGRFTVDPGWEAGVFAGLALVALGLRLWGLDGRSMHYDESLHLHYAWRMAIGDGYSHSPWMHGPFQLHMVAGMLKLFSDSDFTARLGYALFGSALVALPFFLRAYLGRTGAIVTSVILALSPSMLYFSRFGRNEILIAFWALALLILMWRYVNEGKNRYLYLASAVLALAFATKETAYIVVAIFGPALFLMSATQIIPWLKGRTKLSEMRGAPGFFILLFTLTLPQWSALASIPLGAVGLDVVEEGVGEVGLPVWGAPFVSFPIFGLPLWLNAVITGAIVAVPLWAVVFTTRGRRNARWLVPGAGVLALAYAMGNFPGGIIARDFLLTFAVLAGTLVASAITGLMWRWKVWLVCAGIFYLIWTMLYTSVFGLFVQGHNFCPSEVGGTFGTLCSKFGGVYTGSWQSLAYWLEQQDVARGGQPWYYHFLLGSVYEFLPLLFGGIAIIYFLKKGDVFGWMLVFWAVLTFGAYIAASEKMPWLLVNIALPFSLLAGKFIGEIIERVSWSIVVRQASEFLLVLPPLFLLGGGYLVLSYLDGDDLGSWRNGGLLVSIIILALAAGILVAKAGLRVGMTLVTLSMGVLVLGFSTFVAFRASYSYDDTPVEMLAYAQGSADLAETARTLNSGVFDGQEQGRVVDVDRMIWYPFNWYVRHEQKEGTLRFQCYKDENEDGYASYCNRLEEPPSTRAVLLSDSHGNRDSSHLQQYEKSGPFKNLLWFPESYRRPSENRKNESVGEELKEDFAFVRENIVRREAWKNALDYFLFRKIGSQWWDNKYFEYFASEQPTEGATPDKEG